MNIINSSVSMRSEPSVLSALETECLFGETVEILNECLDWVYCKLITDEYCGWIQKKGLGKLKSPTHRIIAKRSFIYKDKSPKSDSILYLPMGAKLKVEDINYDWAEIKLNNSHKIQVGYVPSKHIVSLDHKFKDWVASALILDGTPYKWGGRDTLGIDCSALLQLSYQTYGKSIPRNTSQQIKLNKKLVENVNDLKRGCVVFWDGHVGIMTSSLNCIHANAFHMQTKIEPLNETINRIGKNFNILKMMDFN